MSIRPSQSLSTPVALFRRRFQHRKANQPTSQAALPARPAHALALRLAGQAIPLCPVVGRPVAVVVQAVAQLRPGRDVLEAPHLALIAVPSPPGALAQLPRRARCPTPRVALVRVAVAVVVPAVALLVVRHDFAHAHVRPVAIETWPVSPPAHAHPHRSHGPGVAGLDQRAAAVCLVRLAVAVVVEAIADFGAGLAGLRVAYGRPVGGADPVAIRLAFPDAVVARLRHPEPIVRLPVAVVVLPAADLGRRLSIRLAGQLAAQAVDDPGSADARLPRLAPPTALRFVLVRLPVAVIVQVVATLVRGLAGHARLRPPGRATVHHDGADALAAGLPSETLVRLPVAVVVEPVTDLRLRVAWHARLRRSSGASVHRPGARAHPARVLALLLVRLAVAVVVEPVADLVRPRVDLGVERRAVRGVRVPVAVRVRSLRIGEGRQLDAVRDPVSVGVLAGVGRVVRAVA